MIVLEGPDGSGKSTFAKRLALPVIHPGAPPKTESAEQAFFDLQFRSANTPVIYDRITSISQQVYQQRLFDEWYWNPLWKTLSQCHCVIVYCRPPDDVVLDFSNHTVAEHDDPVQMQYVRDNGRMLMESYDRLMSRIPHVNYDFTLGDDQDLVTRLLKSQFNESEWKLWLREMKRTLKQS